MVFRRQGPRLRRGMGITFYVVRTREGDFEPVQLPPDDCEILATVEPPGSPHESPQFDREFDRE